MEISTSPSSTNRTIARDTGSSPRHSSSPMRRTVAPAPTATMVDQRSWSTATFGAGSVRASDTHRSIDGTTRSMSRHSSSSVSAWVSSPSTPWAGMVGSAVAPASKVNEPSWNRSSSNSASPGSTACGAWVASTPVMAPSPTQMLPVPRSPVMRSRPLLCVPAKRRRTSGRANVSRVPRRATQTSGAGASPHHRHDGSGTSPDSSGGGDSPQEWRRGARPATAAALIASNGGSSLVQIRKAWAAWWISIPRPLTVRTPRAWAAATSGVGAG